MSSSAPKFASFQPKAKAAEPPPPEEARRKGKDHRKRKPSTERSRDERTSPPHDHQRRSDESSKKPYFSDRRGDLDIVKYGTINRYDVPSYRRTGYGNVLGLPAQKIDRDSSTDKKIYMTPLVRQRQKRMLTDRLAAKESRRPLRLVKTAESHQADAARDFIALSSTSKRKRGPEDASDEEVDDAPAVDYRGIDGKRDPDRLDDPDTYYDSDTEAANAHSEVTQKNSRLIRETRDDPSNLQAWLDLVEHQEAMMKLDRATSELSAADRQNLADVRISTYEEALRKIGNEESVRVELLVGLLQEAQRHWADAKVATRWQEVLRKYPHSVELWFGYVDFVQSTFSSFRYDDCRAAFLQAMQALQSTDINDATVTSESRLHLFTRLTTMIQASGYQELALAAWQAALEYTLLTPQNRHDEHASNILQPEGSQNVVNQARTKREGPPATGLIQQFEEFWESEAPRIGEPNSKGWRHTSIDNVEPPTCSISLETAAGPATSISDFSKREAEFISKLRYPGRSVDEVGEDDPFHTIFFSDLREIVASVPRAPAEMQIDAFLCFCGLPPLAGIHTERPWWEDPYLQSSIADSTHSSRLETKPSQFPDTLSQSTKSTLGSRSGDETSRTQDRSDLEHPNRRWLSANNFRMTSDLLVHQAFSPHSSRLSPDFVRSVLKLLVANVPHNEAIGEYLLAFESKHFPPEVAKTAKRLLKVSPTSIRLYNMYGLVEDQLGNAAKAAQIFAAALSIKSKPVDHLHLLSSYVWQALHMGDQVEALRRLLLSAHSPPSTQDPQPDPDAIESAQSALQLSLETALLVHDLPTAVHATSLLSLLAYLTTSCNPLSALSVHANLTSWSTSHRLSTSAHAEQHAQAIARLLAHHVRHTPVVKPSLIRSALEPLIAAFPSSTILLSTYAENEARFAIDDRVRGNMLRVLNLSPASSVVTWTFAIERETLRGEIAGSTAHSVRALYKRATHTDSRGAHSPALWAAWLRFETALLHSARTARPGHEGKRTRKAVDEAAARVKETVHAGLRMLPWSKDFVMLAFSLRGDVFTREELGRLYGVMLEKEHRVYVELEM